MTGSPAASPTERRAALDAALIRLHGRAEAAAELSALHEAAAGMLAADPGARRFHLTHAWVYALVEGDEPAAARLEGALIALGGLRRQGRSPAL